MPTIKRFLLALVLSTCWWHTSSAQEKRTWTSADGRTVEARFVKLEGEEVEIRTDEGLFRLPLSKLSDDDQAYAREQAAKAARRPMRIQERDWKLPTGTIRAKYVRLRDGAVQLQHGRKIVSYAIYNLAPEDITYLYTLLESRGELDSEDLTVQMVVSKEQLARSSEQLVKGRYEKDGKARRKTTEPVPASDPPVEIAAPIVAAEPQPATLPTDTTTQAAATVEQPVAPAAEDPMIPADVRPPPPPIAAAAPATAASGTPSAEQTGLASSDPWERDRAVMEMSNRAAYLWLSGILGLLVVFGPILYALQRMR